MYGKITYLGSRNPWSDRYKILHVGCRAGRNHACQFWWRSVKGFWCGDGSNFGLFYWLASSPLKHSHYRASVWWVKYGQAKKNRSIIVSEMWRKSLRWHYRGLGERTTEEILYKIHIFRRFRKQSVTAPTWLSAAVFHSSGKSIGPRTRGYWYRRCNKWFYDFTFFVQITFFTFFNVLCFPLFYLSNVIKAMAKYEYVKIQRQCNLDFPFKRPFHFIGWH